MKSYIPILRDLDVRGKRVLVRVDFNVPIKDAKITDTTRIRGALPTIQYLLQEEARVILLSHLGRPDGKPNLQYSLEPVGAKLSELLNRDVIMADDCIGDGPRSLSQQMRPKEILLLENVRFHPEEEANSPDFAHKLLEICDRFVADAFGTLHRAHASTSAVPKLAPFKAIGLLVQKELSVLQSLRESPKRPFTLIMGGAKVSDKIGLLDKFIPKVDNIVIGGAMGYAFLKAKGTAIGSSLCDDRQVRFASQALRSAEARNIKVYLPEDHVIVRDVAKPAEAKVTEGAEIPVGWKGVDIGPKTLKRYENALSGIETIFWNGPMGIFETPEYAKGTFGLAERIAVASANKIAGGGDVVAAITEAGFESKFDFISTGGGAALEYLEGKELPGLSAMEIPERS